MRKADARTWTLVTEVLAWAVVGILAIVLVHVRAPGFPVLAVLVFLFAGTHYLEYMATKSGHLAKKSRPSVGGPVLGPGGQPGYHPSGVLFPSAGCWQLIGETTSSALTLVVDVVARK
jgi:hypothetical protein